jgi:L-arabinose transport system substrate-binding protein
MKKKILGLILCILLVGSIFTGCSKIQSTPNSSLKKNKEIVIAGIYKSGDQVWFINEGKAAEKVAKSMGASKFEFFDAKMNPDTYLNDIDNVIAQKVDGVITCTPDQKLSSVIVNKLKIANIPVIACDDALQDENGNKIAPWVGISAYKVGQTNGEWMTNYIKQNGLDKDSQVAVLVLTINSVSDCVERTKGELDEFKEILPNYPDSRIFKADYDGQIESGFSAAAEIITAHPQIKKWMVMTANEEGAVGATRALEQNNLDEQSCVIGIGGYLAKDEFKKSYSAMKAAAYFSADAVGGYSAKLLMDKILKGKEIPMETSFDAIVVTKINYKQVMGDEAN